MTSGDLMRTAIVTGATSGLGLITARALAREGFHVLIPARDPDRARAAQDRIRVAVPDASLAAQALDLADLSSVRRFADTVSDAHDRLDLLVNNAGIMWGPRTQTSDGFEAQLGINHLAHFALTGLLLPLLHQAPEARVVTVGSTEHLRGVIDLDDLQMVRSYHPRRAYQRAKLANVMFGHELHERLSAARSPVYSVMAHPGFAATGLQTRTTSRALRPLSSLINRLVAQTPEQGARAQIRASLDHDIAAGSYLGPTRMSELRGPLGPARTAPAVHDHRLRKRLWDASEILTGVQYRFPQIA